MYAKKRGQSPTNIPYMSTKPAPDKPMPVFSRQAFWSGPTKGLDVHKDADFLIARVFDAGKYEDMREAIRYYGIEKISEALCTAPDLQSSTIAYASIWLGLQPEAFRAHRRAAENPIAYPTF